MWSEVVAYFLLAAVVLGYEPDGFEHMYELGKESYLEEDWGYCVKFMEEAVRDYNSYRVRCLLNYLYPHFDKCHTDVTNIHHY